MPFDQRQLGLDCLDEESWGVLKVKVVGAEKKTVWGK